VSEIDGSPRAPAPKADTVDAHVSDVTAPVATIAPSGPTVPQNWPLTLDGTPSTGASTFQWTYVRGANDPAIALGPTAGPMLSFTFPKTLNTATFDLRVCNAAPPPVCATTTVRIPGQPGPLTGARARNAGGRWVVDRHGELDAAERPHRPRGQHVGRPGHPASRPRRAGQHQLDVRNSPVPRNSRVSLELARGGVLLDQPVRWHDAQRNRTTGAAGRLRSPRRSSFMLAPLAGCAARRPPGAIRARGRGLPAGRSPLAARRAAAVPAARSSCEKSRGDLRAAGTRVTQRRPRNPVRNSRAALMLQSVREPRLTACSRRRSPPSPRCRRRTHPGPIVPTRAAPASASAARRNAPRSARPPI
jgi:hypothetical protein